MTDKYTFKTKPFKHQLDALLQSAGKKNFAYFMEMGCVDGETEFLSNKGWMKFKDFDIEQLERPFLIAQAIPPAKNEDFRAWSMEWVEPERYIKKDCCRWMKLNSWGSKASYKDYVVSFMFTADHNIPAEFSTTVGIRSKGLTRKTTQDWTKTAEDVYNYFIDPKVAKYILQRRRVTMPTCALGGFRGFKSEYYEPDEDLMQLSEYEMRFMVACMADGTFPNKHDNKVDFYFVKERKARRLEYLAMRAGIPMVKEIKKGRLKTTIVYHAIAPLKMKIYDERFYSLPLDRLQWIVSECIAWDGSITQGRACFFSIHKGSADFIQYAMIACGWTAMQLYNGVKKLYTVSASMKRLFNKDLLSAYEHTDDIVTGCDKEWADGLDSTKKSMRGLSILSGQIIEEEAPAYCFRVPSGYFFARKDGMSFITGNSGKTKVMIDNIGVLHKKGQITGALVFAPKGVYRNWSDKEIPTHLPDDIDRELIVWDAASSQSKKNKLQKQIRDWDGKKLQIMVFNIESLISEKGRKLIVDFIKHHNGNIFALVDESTCIKNYKAKRTKAAIDIGKKCKVRRIATGSPITNSPLDLYSQCAFLDKSLLGCGSYYSFKNSYADFEKIQNRQGFSYEKIIRYKNLDKLSNLLDGFSYRITKKECLDLPDKTYITRDVELTDEQRKAYNEMYDYQFALLKDDNGEVQEMSTQIILTKFLRLHQILCGTFTTDDGKVIRLPNNRLKALQEVLDETSGKAIIWATYLDNIKEIEEMLKSTYGSDSYVTYYGDTSSEDRSKAITLFQDESSPVRFFLGNVQTAGRGITLTAASTVIYYSNNFSLELRQQSEDRAHRLGQKNKVTYIDLVVRGSLDEKIIKSLIEKRNIANEVLKDDLDDWISLQTSQNSPDKEMMALAS